MVTPDDVDFTINASMIAAKNGIFAAMEVSS